MVFLSLAWYTYVTTYTRWHLRKRNKLWLAFLASTSGQDTLFESVADAIRARYGSLRDVFTGRYMNVTFEYREQGVHEFLFHQLIWRPLSGQLFWNGGTADKAELDANLPIEPMNWDKLRKASRKGKERAVEESSPMHSILASGNTSEEEWEKLEHSRISTPAAMLASVTDDDKITVTWFGQSTCLVQMQGVTFLTDPVFGDKTIDSIFASPRLCDTPCSLSELLQQHIVDVVLLSHDHFDHLDENVVRSLGNKALWIVPLGLAGWFTKRGVTNIQEMDWWESKSLAPILSMNFGKDLEVHCTPAQHWSGRTPWGANQSLWCGFVVKSRSSGRSFYHCGDTGYSQDLFQAIGRMHAPITLALLPIGSYDPRWIMSTVHTDPEGSVHIHKDLGVKKSVAVHHSTWIMSDERYDDPPKELSKQMERYDVEEDAFVVIPVGRTLEI